MRTLDSNTQTQIAGDDIWPITLIDLEIGNTTYRITDNYRDVTFGGNNYLANGNLLSVSQTKNTISSDNSSLTLSLSGIQSAFRTDVLAADATGGRVTLSRAFNRTDSLGNVTARYTIFEGFVYSVTLVDESVDPGLSVGGSTFTVSVDVRSKWFLLESQPGRFTNLESQHEIDSADNGFELVNSLNGSRLRFGAPQ